jgi:predicted nuclease with TOPRIM domain
MPVKTKTKKYTVNTLGITVDYLGEKVDKMGEKFDKMRGDMGKMQGDMGKMQGDMGKMQGDMGKMQGDITELRGDTVKMQKNFDKMLVKQVHMEGEIKGLATRSDIKEFKNEILNAVDDIKKKFDDHAAEHKANLAAHDRIQGDVNEVRQHFRLKVKHPV